MVQILSLFNHKGGVSKTTTTFNLGWMLGRLGKKVLLIDADPQRNLTGTVVGLDESEKFYSEGIAKTNNIYKLFEPIIIKGRGHSVTTEVELYQVPNNQNVFLLPGSDEFAEIDVLLGVSLKTSSSLSSMVNFPGVIPDVIRKLARKNSIDIVLIDMSPSIGAINQCLLMGSDFFIIPTSPDFYCYQAIQSLAYRIPVWDDELSSFRKTNIDVPFPSTKPKFLGIISQRYRPRQHLNDSNKDTTKAFQIWIDKINNKVKSDLVPMLIKRNMCILESTFKSCFPEETPYNLVSIPEFNALIARSHEHAIPIYELSETELLSWGYSQVTQLENITKFKNLFTNFAQEILKVLDNH